MRTFMMAALACLGTLSPPTASAQTLAALPLVPASVPAEQRQPAARAARRPAPHPNQLQIRAFGSVGTTWFTSSSTFEAVLGDRTGQDFGGGVNLTQGPGYLEIGARRFAKTGERVFVTDTGEVFRLGIPTEVTMTPLEVAAGWRFATRFGRIIPHLGAGYTRLKYEETSDFAESDEDVSESFNGFHLIGGAEVRVARWVGLTAEVVWTSVPDAIGEGGASKAFDEDNLGGTSVRLKLVIGR
jgi:hypothetical protein